MGSLRKPHDTIAEIGRRRTSTSWENHRIVSRDIMPFENGVATTAAPNVVCVARQLEDSQALASVFHRLGFKGTCAGNLEEAFTVVAEDPEDWAFLCVVLDPNITKSALDRWVHLIRLTNYRLPIILFSDLGPQPNRQQEPTRLGDCYVMIPQNAEELDQALGVAVRSNRSLGTCFSHFQNYRIPRPSRFPPHSRSL